MSIGISSQFNGAGQTGYFGIAKFSVNDKEILHIDSPISLYDFNKLEAALMESYKVGGEDSARNLKFHICNVLGVKP